MFTYLLTYLHDNEKGSNSFGLLSSWAGLCRQNLCVVHTTRKLYATGVLSIAPVEELPVSINNGSSRSMGAYGPTYGS